MSQWNAARAAFFRAVFGQVRGGYICVATIKPGTRNIREEFFAWPDEQDELLEHISSTEENTNVYYCPQLIADPNYRRGPRGSARVKENIELSSVIWADLDACHPDKLLLHPTFTIESSPGRYQAIWQLAEPIAATAAEEIARRVHYHHLPDGADKSGWDLTQLLRVPYTRNWKYEEGPIVGMSNYPSKYREQDFSPYPTSSKRTGGGIPMPEAEEVPTIESPVQYMQERRRFLNSDVFRLFSDEPEGASWSEALWKLMMLLFEGGLSREEVLAITRQAACNKYARDDRPERHLWDDVCRAYIKHMEDIKAVVVPELEQVDLLTDEEQARVRQHYTFVERYVAWATSLGDAAPQYHQAAAFVILSAILCGRVSLPTSFGTIVPNLWFMLLADTTLTRKSTAMDIGVDLLAEIDTDMIMATDGSLEGLLQGLSMRPGRPSIFLRDEFTGLLESMTKKDYMAGMAEMLTKLYDGKLQKRILRKEIIEIRDPCLIVFAGGIRSKTQQLLTFEHIASGFIPRFIFLTAESDVKKVKPLGPPVVRDMTVRDELLAEMRQMYSYYSQVIEMDVAAAGIQLAPPRKWRGVLTPQAWARYGKFESALLDAGVKSEHPDLVTPLYARLGISALKAAVLLAASESRDDELIIDEIHILHAISYAEKWRHYAIDVINGVGMTQSERELERVYGAIKKQPGVSRSQLMQMYHLTAQNANAIFATLEQRGQLVINKMGKGTTYRALGGDDEA